MAKALAQHLWIGETCLQRPAFLVLGSFQHRTQVQRDKLLSTGTTDLFSLPRNNTISMVRAKSIEISQALIAGRHAVLSLSDGARKEDLEGRYPFLDEITRERNNVGAREVASSVLSICRDRISGVVVAGGGTSEIIARDVLAAQQFENLTYLDEGVAASLSVDADDATIPFVTKAGNWGGEDVLLRSILWVQRNRTRNSNVKGLSNA